MALVSTPSDNGADNERVSEGWTVAEMRRYEAILTWVGYGALVLAAGFAGASFIIMSQIANWPPVLESFSTSSKYFIPALILGALFLLAKFYQHAMRDALEDNREAQIAFSSMERDLSILKTVLAETSSKHLDPSFTELWNNGGEGGGQQGAAG